ncbi:recombinase family protein [Streptomyces olivoreticuli]
MQHQLNIIERAHMGNLNGLNFAGLVRLSFELEPNREFSGVPFSGADINNRDEQENHCQGYVENRQGNYVYTYDEPDTSAWKKKRIKQPDGSYIYRVIRPVFEGALEDLKRGVAPNGQKLDGLIVYDIDRLTRDNRHLEDAIEVVEHFKRPILDIRGSLDLLTDNGRSAARYIVTSHNSASTATSRRLRDSHHSRAVAGIPVGGNRAFGWTQDKRTLQPTEAKLIQVAAKDLLAGVGVNTILRRWLAAGVLTPKGKPWTRRPFVLMITSPRMAGFRVYGPQDKPLHERYIVHPVTGEPVKGQYPAILDEETWQAVVALLTGPDRPGRHEHAGKAKRLLSGIIRCAECGSKLVSQAKGDDRFDYACKPPISSGGCGKAAGAGKAIDEIVTKLVLAYLGEREVTKEVAPWPGAEELALKKSKKANLLAQFKENPDMGPYIWPQIRELDNKIAELIKERAAFTRKTAGPKTANVHESWATIETEQKRAIVRELVEAVVLKRATRGSNRFDPTRLSVVWSQE